MDKTNTAELRDRITGSLLAGAAGDALGAPVEFMSMQKIISTFGPEGIRNFAPAYGGFGKITDDTQMTLFTAEGLIRGAVRAELKGICDRQGVVAHAYQRWLLTQRLSNDNVFTKTDGWLFNVPELHAQRAPGNTCLNALETTTCYSEPAINNSKGCGGVMRVAPVAFASGWYTSTFDAEWAFQMAKDICALTHGHPSGQLPGGFFAAYLALILNGESKLSAAIECIKLLKKHRDHDETLNKVELAIELSHSSPGNYDSLASIGEGWIAEEALAMSLYCALSTDSTEDAIILAVNHAGDSDSTGAITGNIMGLLNGMSSIPDRWLAELELKDVIAKIASDMVSVSGQADELWDRYPGH